MAHIPDGILSAPVLIGGSVAAAALVAMGLRRMDDRAIVRTALLAAAFFVVSLVSVPLGATSVHLMLAGLMGLMLGWGAAVAVLVGLLLQAVLFGIGGLTTLGVNTLNIAGPGILLGLLLGPVVRRVGPVMRLVVSGLAGGGAVMGTAGLVCLSLVLSAPEYTPVARIVLATYAPLALVDGIITAMVVGFLARAEPEALRPLGANK